MSDTKTAIPPALTPEEWAARMVEGRDGGDHFVVGESVVDGTLRLDAGAGFDTTNVTLDQRTRQALAALALYGQPFGFTREDVAMLREVACCPSHTASCNTLADRIAALLPPE